MSNLQEFLTGTNPRDATSVFRVRISDADVSRPTIRFTAQPGRTYRIEYTGGFASAAWTRLSDISSGDSVREISVTDPTPQAQRTTRFYRVIVGP